MKLLLALSVLVSLTGCGIFDDQVGARREAAHQRYQIVAATDGGFYLLNNEMDKVRYCSTAKAAVEAVSSKAADPRTISCGPAHDFSEDTATKR